MGRLLSLTGSLALAVPFLSSGCNLKAEPPAPFETLITVTSDPGVPVPGAVITKGGKEGPSTGAEGKVTLKIGGTDGESVDLMVKCPADLVSPIKPVTVLLRRNTGAKLPQYDVLCPPKIRHMVVAVRADNGPNLPVKVYGKTVGYTDAHGAFTYALPLAPGDGVEMSIDTSGNPLISPHSPSTILTMKPYDDVVTFDQKFKVKVIPKPPPKPRIVPIQIRPRHGLS